MSNMVIRRVQNWMQSTILLTAIIVMPSALAYWLFGGIGLVIALGTVFIGMIAATRVSLRKVLSMMGAKRLEYEHSPRLFDLVDSLCAAARIGESPEVYILRDNRPNAFAIGRGNDVALVVSHGLLNDLEPGEVRAVLAHEISHIKHGDIKLLNLSQHFLQMTKSISTAGLFILFLSIPFMVSGHSIGLFPIVLMIIAPAVSQLLVLALSRSREFAADLEAARIVGEPYTLARALSKIDYQQRSFFERLFNVSIRSVIPVALNTHPPTEERIARLRELVSRDEWHRHMATGRHRSYNPFEAFFQSMR